MSSRHHYPSLVKNRSRLKFFGPEIDWEIDQLEKNHSLKNRSWDSGGNIDWAEIDWASSLSAEVIGKGVIFDSGWGWWDDVFAFSVS